jgi:hypothetical protein
MDAPDPPRLTARQLLDDPGMPRDAFAGILSWQFHHGFPQDGEAVRVFDRRSGDFLAEGTWEARTDQPDGSYGAVLHTDEHEVFSVPGGVRTEVTGALPRVRPQILTEPQLVVAAELLLELAAVYRGEPMGALADEVAHTITSGLGVELDGQDRG